MVASPAAIITLQFGQYANYVGSHFWNLQDEGLGLLADEQLGYAAQEVLAGKVFTHSVQPRPRLVIVDSQGCLGGVRLRPATADSASEVLWSGQVQAIERPRVQPSKFYSLLCEENDESSDRMEEDGEDQESEGAGQVQNDAVAEIEAAAANLDTEEGPGSFSDFLKAVLHPRSVVQVPLMGSFLTDGPQGYGGITSHGELFGQAKQDIEEVVRQFAEESDTLEGLQMLADPSTAWAGVAAQCAVVLADDYSHQSRLLYAVQPPPASAVTADGSAAGPQSLSELLSGALAMAQWCRDCSLVLPMQAPAAMPGCAGYHPERQFHSSALLAATLDTCTLPFRLAPLSGAAVPARQGVTQPSEATDAGSVLNGFGVPSQGATSLSSWCANLSQPAANVACVGVALPAVSTAPEAPAAEDARLSARERRLKGLPSDAGKPSSALVQDGLEWCLASQQDPIQKLLMDSVVWRGPRHNGQAVEGAAAVSQLTASLAAEGRRAVHHCCAAALPLPVPLPFPGLYTTAVDAHGLPVAQEASMGSAAAHPDARCAARAEVNRAVRDCPVLTRTAASAALEVVLKGHAEVLRGGMRCAAGKACLARWEVDPLDAEEQREALLQNAGLYRDVEWSSDEEGWD